MVFTFWAPGFFRSFEEMNGVWETLEWISITLIFYIGGLLVGYRSLDYLNGQDLLNAFVAYLLLFLLRAVLIFLFLPVMNLVGKPIKVREAVFLVLAGPRGSVSISLALNFALLTMQEGVTQLTPYQGNQMFFYVGMISLLSLVGRGGALDACLKCLRLTKEYEVITPHVTLLRNGTRRNLLEWSLKLWKELPLEHRLFIIKESHFFAEINEYMITSEAAGTVQRKNVKSSMSMGNVIDSDNLSSSHDIITRTAVTTTSAIVPGLSTSNISHQSHDNSSSQHDTSNPNIVDNVAIIAATTTVTGERSISEQSQTQTLSEPKTNMPRTNFFQRFFPITSSPHPTTSSSQSEGGQGLGLKKSVISDYDDFKDFENYHSKLENRLNQQAHVNSKSNSNSFDQPPYSTGGVDIRATEKVSTTSSSRRHLELFVESNKSAIIEDATASAHVPSSDPINTSSATNNNMYENENSSEFLIDLRCVFLECVRAYYWKKIHSESIPRFSPLAHHLMESIDQGLETVTMKNYSLRDWQYIDYKTNSSLQRLDFIFRNDCVKRSYQWLRKNVSWMERYEYMLFQDRISLLNLFIAGHNYAHERIYYCYSRHVIKMSLEGKDNNNNNNDNVDESGGNGEDVLYPIASGRQRQQHREYQEAEIIVNESKALVLLAQQKLSDLIENDRILKLRETREKCQLILYQCENLIGELLEDALISASDTHYFIHVIKHARLDLSHAFRKYRLAITEPPSNCSLACSQ